MVQMLDVHNKNLVLLWAALRADYNTVNTTQEAIAILNFLGYVVTDDDIFFDDEAQL